MSVAVNAVDAVSAAGAVDVVDAGEKIIVSPNPQITTWVALAGQGEDSHTQESHIIVTVIVIGFILIQENLSEVIVNIIDKEIIHITERGHSIGTNLNLITYATKKDIKNN